MKRFRTGLLVWALCFLPCLGSAQQLDRLDVPTAMRPCLVCHRSEVADFLRHGMSRSLGKLVGLSLGSVTNPANGNVYETLYDGRRPELRTRFPSGGVLKQSIVGWIGAGLFDISWVGAEIDPVTLAPSGRLFFAPVETLASRGLTLSPFELHGNSPGPGFALTGACLECHTDTRLETLSQVGADGSRSHVYPSNSLGVNAFEELAPIGCEACHGDTGEHLKIMLGQRQTPQEEIGLRRLSRLPADRQRDVCSRCHLQGDVRLTLDESAHPVFSLPGRIPVLVASREVEDHRFVGQMERLALSVCFRESPGMTCTTCHFPHTGAREQGTAAFDAACRKCHPSTPAAVHQGLDVPSDGEVEGGCVDCHVRHSQPFDLPHVQTADHFIRRRVPPAVRDLPHRSFADPEGPLKIFDDGRSWGGSGGGPRVQLEKLLQTSAGQRWKAGVLAMGYLASGRVRDAVDGFGQFPAPGTPEARRGSAPPGLIPLETSPLFHHLRADLLEKTGHLEDAVKAYTDSLVLQPNRAGARMARARLRAQTGNLLGALEDTQTVIESHPKAEQPWDLRASIALSKGRIDLAAAALTKSTQLSPSNASAWHLLGKLRLKLGQTTLAEEALRHAFALDPKRDGLAADLKAASQ